MFMQRQNATQMGVIAADALAFRVSLHAFLLARACSYPNAM